MEQEKLTFAVGDRVKLKQFLPGLFGIEPDKDYGTGTITSIGELDGKPLYWAYWPAGPCWTSHRGEEAEQELKKAVR